MTDYEVKTALLIDTGFDDRECNHLMFDGRKSTIAEEIQAVFESDTREEQERIEWIIDSRIMPGKA